MNKESNTAWITGGGSGIGQHLALLLASKGWRVATSGRTLEKLETTAGKAKGLSGSIYAHPCDVTDHEAVKATVAAIKTELGGLNLAVLNAGAFAAFDGKRFPLEQLRKELEVNYLGVAHCIDAVLPIFREQGNGHFVVVASVAGYGGLPLAASYGATKAAVINLMEGLKFDFDKLGIKTQIVTPGFVDTPLTEQNEFPMPFLMRPEDAAQEIYDGMQSNRFEITFPKRLSYTLKFLQKLPYGLYFALTKKGTGG